MKSMKSYLLSVVVQIMVAAFLIWAVNKEYGAGAEIVGVVICGAVAFSSWAWYPRTSNKKRV